MRLRLQLFEFEDLPWFPKVIRAGMLDYLRFMISQLRTYQPIVPLLHEALLRSGQTQVLELGAGAGGGTEGVFQALRQVAPSVGMTLTDLYPQPEAWKLIQQRTHGGIQFFPSPVDARQVPENLSGFRTIFSAFHHFSPPLAEAILADAVRQRSGIGVFEGAGKHWLELLLACTILPVVQLLVTPFILPFRWNRLVFTYLIPLIPLCTLWDGSVSILRLYPPDRLLAMARRADPAGKFHWQAGKCRHSWGPKVTYLIGWPA